MSLRLILSSYGKNFKIKISSKNPSDVWISLGESSYKILIEKNIGYHLIPIQRAPFQGFLEMNAPLGYSWVDSWKPFTIIVTHNDRGTIVLKKSSLKVSVQI